MGQQKSKECRGNRRRGIARPHHLYGNDRPPGENYFHDAYRSCRDFLRHLGCNSPRPAHHPENALHSRISSCPASDNRSSRAIPIPTTKQNMRVVLKTMTLFPAIQSFHSTLKTTRMRIEYLFHLRHQFIIIIRLDYKRIMYRQHNHPLVHKM